jgi:hypothetical protein
MPRTRFVSSTIGFVSAEDNEWGSGGGYERLHVEGTAEIVGGVRIEHGTAGVVLCSECGSLTSIE